MNVSLATQLYSRHAALAMRLLRQEEKKAADDYNSNISLQIIRYQFIYIFLKN